MKQLLLVLITVMTLAACNNGGWSAAEKEKSTKACMNGIEGKVDEATAKRYCDCFVEKMMQKYPTYAQADKNGTFEEGIKIGQACAGELKLNKGNNEGDNGGGLGNGLGNGLTDNSWSDEDKQKFLNTCLQNAKNAGADDQTSNTHCNCTLNKIMKKYSSWDEANRKMSREEVNAIEQECIQERNGSNQ